MITRVNVGTNDQEIIIPNDAKFIVTNAVVKVGQTTFTRLFPVSIFSLSRPIIQDVFTLFYSPTIYCINHFSLSLVNGKYLLKYLQWNASSDYQSDGYIDVYYM